MRLHFTFVGIFAIAALLPLAAHNESPSNEIEAVRSAEPAPQTQAAPPGKTPGGFTVSGADAELAVNATAGTSPSILFQENGTTMFSLLANSLTDTVSLRNSTGMTLMQISQDGQVDQTYSGSDSFAFSVTGNTSGSLAQIYNLGSGNGVYGYSYNGNGVYGFSFNGYAMKGENHQIITETMGFLGSRDYGAYGCWYVSPDPISSGNYGVLGSEDYGVYSENAHGTKGYLSSAGYGV